MWPARSTPTRAPPRRWPGPAAGRGYMKGVPELPDIESYVEALRERVLGEPLVAVKLASPFLVRTADPPLREVEGRRVEAVRRLGKRIVLGLEGDLFLGLHLMIAGRLRWQASGGKKPARTGTPLATFEFPKGTLLLTEAGTKRRAALHLLRGEAGLATLARGGLEP